MTMIPPSHETLALLFLIGIFGVFWLFLVFGVCFSGLPTPLTME